MLPKFEARSHPQNIHSITPSKMASAAQRSTHFKGPGRIDVHHHCFPATVAELRSEFRGNKFGVPFNDFPVKPEDHIQYMDEIGVQTAVIVSRFDRAVESGADVP